MGFVKHFKVKLYLGSNAIPRLLGLEISDPFGRANSYLESNKLKPGMNCFALKREKVVKRNGLSS